MGVEGADLFTRLKRKGIVLAEREEQSATMIILHLPNVPKIRGRETWPQT